MHRFRSRVSVVILVFIFVSIIPIFFLGEPNEEAWIAYSVLGGSIGLVLLMLFGMRYEIEEDLLTIKLGPIPYGKINLSDIKAVERSYNPLSSPAASLKRLYVSSEKRDMLISPANEEEFIRILKSKNPNIKIDVVDKKDWWRFWDWDI